jgi:ABC-2 type transport system permease protein
MADMADARAAGAIYDLGYQPYTGPRLGRWFAVRTLISYSFATVFGVGRADKAKSIPTLIVALVYLPALVQVGVASATGIASLIQYSTYLEFTAFLIALFAAAQAPELIVTDKQQGVLSLYLSRPLKATDYAAAKLVALVLAMLVITLGPQLLLLTGRIFLGASPMSVLKTEWTKLFPIVGGTVMTSVFVASIAMLLASFASRRGYGTASVIVFFLLAPALVEMFRSVTAGALKRYSVLAHPVYLITGFANWLFDIEARRRSAVGRADLPGQYYLYVMAGVSIVCIAALLRRYRRLDA